MTVHVTHLVPTSVGCMVSGDKGFVIIATLLFPHLVPNDENVIELILVTPLMAGYDSIMFHGNSGANPGPDEKVDNTKPICPPLLVRGPRALAVRCALIGPMVSTEQSKEGLVPIMSMRSSWTTLSAVVCEREGGA